MYKYLVYKDGNLIDVLLASSENNAKELWGNGDNLTVKRVELTKQERISIAIEAEKHFGGLAKVIK